MPQTDPRIDEYIERSAEFARPVLWHIRELVHVACPDIEETIKWGFPHYMHKGMLCSTAAFKQHCAMNFWKHSLLDQKAFAKKKVSMGIFGRITSLKDLPADDVMIALIRQAAELNEKGIRAEKKPAAAARLEAAVPDDLSALLKANKKAREAFDSFPPSCKREYVEWITEAKTDATRSKRLATTIEWLTEGKRRNWKYEKAK